MAWFILISIIVAVAVLVLSWRYGLIQSHYWIASILCLLAIVSVFSGRWHNHFEPLHYQHQYQVKLSKASSAESDLSTEITKFNHHDNGHFLVFPHRSEPNLADAQYRAINASYNLRKHRPSRQASDYHYDIVSRNKDIHSITRQLKRHRIYFRTMADERVIKQELRHHQQNF